MRRYAEVDVFATGPLTGNPLAVVVDGEGIPEDRMQAFAAWTNLSETTFLLPATDPEADYLVRIFTPVRELPFAGHPTLGSAATWLAAGGTPRRDGVVVQQCGIGRVAARRSAAARTTWWHTSGASTGRNGRWCSSDRRPWSGP